MNIALRKLALLEKSIAAREEVARLEGYTTSPVNPALKENVTKLMNKVRTL